ncbi:hypothetical protein AB8I12_22505, partial [Salmonella enterica]
QLLNGERTKHPDSTRYQTSYRGHHSDKALEVAHIFWGKRFGGGYWISWIGKWVPPVPNTGCW